MTGASGLTMPSYGSYASTGTTTASSTATQRVLLTMGDNVFFPAEISVPAGTQVTWLNNGRQRHTTTASGLWDSGAVEPGSRWAAVYRVPGSYDYLCTIHPDEMRGRLTITSS